MEWFLILAVTGAIGVGTAVTFDHNKSGRPVFETPHVPHADLVTERDRLLARHAELILERDRLTVKLDCLKRHMSSCQ